MFLEIDVKLQRGHFNLATQLSVDNTRIGLFGKSGAGKSTVLGLIAGLIQPQSGHIVLDGKILFDSRKGILIPHHQRPVGAVLQTGHGDLTQTVRTNLVHAYNQTLRYRRILSLEFVIELFELGPILDTVIEHLSVGELQRVGLARSLLKSPQLLLLDEAFATLGNDYRSQLLPILKRLETELGIAVLYASQSLGEILELTDQLVVLEHGKVLCNGSLRDIAKQQGILRYLGLSPAGNLLPVTISSHNISAGCTLAHSFGIPLTLPLRPHLAVGSLTHISIRAKDIALSRFYIEGISIQNQIKGRVCALIPSGESIIVQIDCGETLLAEITPGACHDMALQENETVYCLIKTHSIAYFSEFAAPPFQRVVHYGGGQYYLDRQGLNNSNW